MTHPPYLLYFNPLFDLELGGYPLDAVAASAKQMSPLFGLMGSGRDRLLLDVAVPGEYWDYLDRNGIGHATPQSDGEDLSGYAPQPWGWNVQAADRLQAAGIRCIHPALATVRETNSREWCAAFNAATGTGVPGSCFCTSSEELEAALERLAERFPLAAKPAFGASGYGFVRMRGGDGFSAGERSRIGPMLERDGCTVEPWLHRTADLSSSCQIAPDGTITDLCHYQCHITGHGAFYGVSLCDSNALIDRYREELERSAALAAGALATAGYYGPASFDSFVYHEAAKGTEMLAPVVEINARQGMSAIARALFEKTGGSAGGCCLLRFISRKKAKLPGTYKALYELLGEDRFGPAGQRGILCASPLRLVYGKERIQPARSAFFIRADAALDMWEMDARLRGLFARPG